MTNALAYHEFFRHSDKVGMAIATGGMGLTAMDAYGEDPAGFRMEGLVMKVQRDHFAGAIRAGKLGATPSRTALLEIKSWQPVII